MTSLLAICRNTFVQTIRQPIYGVLILGTFLMLVIDLPLAGWTMGVDYHKTDQQMLINLGLSSLLMAGLFISAFSASEVLAREIEDKTALTVVSKPVSRATFVLGKFLGVAGAVAVAYYLCALVLLMTVRHHVMPAASDPFDWPVIVLGTGSLVMTLLVALFGNLFFGWTFASAGVWAAMFLMTLAMGVISVVGKGWRIVPFGAEIDPQVPVAIVMIFMAVLVFVAIAVAASTRLGQVMTLFVCLIFLAVGSMHPFLFGQHADTIFAARVLGWLAPNLSYFNPLDAITSEVAIPAKFVLLAAAYCAAYVGAVLAIGIAMFQRRALEAETSSGTLPGAVALVAWSGRIAALACAVAGAVMLSTPDYHTAQGIALAAGLLMACVILWALWGFFGRGVAWSYWVVMVLAVAVLGDWLAGLAFPKAAPALRLNQGPVVALVEAAIAAVVLIVLVMPRTRRHFKSSQ